MKGTLHVAIQGVDGTGKSSLANVLERHYRVRCTVQRYHWRPRFLPPFRSNLTRLEVKNPHQKQPRSRLASLLLPGYFFLDFLCLSIKLKFMSHHSKLHLVLHERFFDDLAFDSLRYGLDAIAIGAAKFLRNFLPRPNLTFVLVGEPGEIHARKEELSLEEVQRQIDLMELYYEEGMGCVFVTVTGRSLCEVSRELIEAIDDRLGERT